MFAAMNSCGNPNAIYRHLLKPNDLWWIYGQWEDTYVKLSGARCKNLFLRSLRESSTGADAVNSIEMIADITKCD